MKKITIVLITFFYLSGVGQTKLNTSKKELSSGSSSQKQKLFILRISLIGLDKFCLLKKLLQWPRNME